MEVLTIPIPLQAFVGRFSGAALLKSFADPEAASRRMAAGSLFIETADPPAADIITREDVMRALRKATQEAP